VLRISTLLVTLLLAACDAGPKTGSAATGNNNAPAAPGPASPNTTLTPGAVDQARGAATGEKFGAGVTLTESMPVDKLLAEAKAHVGKTVRVEGMIVDVCPKRGCWMDLAGPAAGQKVRFKVTDGEMVFPMDAKGKYAVVEGVVAVNELTLEETKEYLAYQQKEYGAEVDPASVTEPMSIVRLDGTGAMLRDKK
jgi:hypothetical protein